ncbi:hypothetical protein [Salinibacter grassmerensis]|uniref:hypothetical protein n=1 Tax=Salinibacter grassmerensis TaxID=3040353 RepID=UPI0021E8A2D3|nr:hypothetical protein [Salinibacter grassmerensis]
MGDDETPATYRTSAFQRGLSLLSVGSLLLLGVLEVTDEGPLLELSLVNVMLTGAMLVTAAAYGLRATVRVSETTVQKRRPLWTDHVLRFEDIQRVHLPVTTEALWLYTEPDGSPDLSIEAQSFERFESLARQVLRRLPQHAEIRDPAGRAEGYRRGGAAGDSQSDSG